MTKSFPVILVASIAWVASAQNRVHLAHADEYSGCTFLGWFQRDSFVRAPELSSTDDGAYERAAAKVRSAFPAGLELFVVNDSGRRSRATVRRTNLVEGLGVYSIEVDFAKGVPKGGALLSTAPLPTRGLRPRTAVLPQSVNQQLQNHARELWQKHLKELSPLAREETPSAFRLGPPKVEVVDEEPTQLVVQYPAEFMLGEGKFDDIWIFFLYSLTDKRIVRSEFGHPEWSNGSTVLTIKPEIYFTVKGNPRIFFVGTYQGGWEEWGHAIYDLRTGRDLIFCY
jgi:hypothetical protein